MLKHRVIPTLLIKNGGLVKTFKFKNPKYVGDPINAIKIFNDKEVDEVIVLDITCTREKRDPDYYLVEKLASECFMPLCYGGGVHTVEQARRLFNIGVEKVSIQTAAVKSIDFIEMLSKEFGNQSIIVSIDIKKNWLMKYKLYSSDKKKIFTKDWLSFLRDAVAAGAGEIVIYSVDCDGTMVGMDLDLIRIACNDIGVPVIAVGGVGSLIDIKNAIAAGASAVAVGAFFVYQGVHRAVLISYPKYQELENMLSNT